MISVVGLPNMPTSTRRLGSPDDEFAPFGRDRDMRPSGSLAYLPGGDREAVSRSRPADIVDQDPLPETREVVTQSGLPVTYVEQERRGLSASRNLALSVAEGDVLAVTDDDCFPDDGWAEGLIDGFRRKPAPDAVTGPILPPPGDPPSDMCALSLRRRERRGYTPLA